MIQRMTFKRLSLEEGSPTGLSMSDKMVQNDIKQARAGQTSDASFLWAP